VDTSRNPPESVRIRPSTESVRIPNRHPRIFWRRNDKRRQVCGVHGPNAAAIRGTACRYGVPHGTPAASPSRVPCQPHSARIDTPRTIENVLPRVKILCCVSFIRFKVIREKACANTRASRAPHAHHTPGGEGHMACHAGLVPLGVSFTNVGVVGAGRLAKSVARTPRQRVGTQPIQPRPPAAREASEVERGGQVVSRRRQMLLALIGGAGGAGGIATVASPAWAGVGPCTLVISATREYYDTSTV